MYMITMNRHARAGFSLMEIMIAVAILGIIVAAVTPALRNYLDRAKISRTKSDLRAIKSAIDQFYMDTAQYPSELRDLISQPSEESIARKWSGPYLERKSLPTDGWGKKYVYEVNENEENPYKLFSYGKKGRAAKEAEWISVWDEE